MRIFTDDDIDMEVAYIEVDDIKFLDFNFYDLRDSYDPEYLGSLIGSVRFSSLMDPTIKVSNCSKEESYESRAFLENTKALLWEDRSLEPSKVIEKLLDKYSDFIEDTTKYDQEEREEFLCSLIDDNGVVYGRPGAYVKALRKQSNK